MAVDCDGGAPKDNPFGGSLVYSYGHRNPQGLAWNAAGELFVAIDRLFEFTRNQEDRRQRRAELVRGSGGKAVDLGEVLFAGQHQFGGSQCGPPR